MTDITGYFMPEAGHCQSPAMLGKMLAIVRSVTRQRTREFAQDTQDTERRRIEAECMGLGSGSGSGSGSGPGTGNKVLENSKHGNRNSSKREKRPKLTH